MDDKVSRLFCAAVLKVADRKTTNGYLFDKAQEFAAAFDGEADDMLFAFYAEQFGFWFGPGMTKSPADCLAVAREHYEFAAKAWESLKASKAEPELSETAQAALAAREARAAAAREERAKREAESVAEAVEAVEAADALLDPPKVDSVLIRDLPIDGRAKSAYARAGLETVGDLKTYIASGKSLDTIKGIGEDFADDTLKAIAALESGE